MPFDRQTLAEQRAFLVALGRALFPSLNFDSPLSYHGKWTTFYASGGNHLQAQIDSVERDSHPLTAGDGKPINNWGSAFGVDRKGATGARKSAAGRVRGAPTSFAVPGTQLRHQQSGLLYQINNSTNVTIPGVIGDPDGFVDADIAALDTGSQTRLKAGAVLNFLVTPAGLESEVILQKDLDEEGFDTEPFGSYRGRVFSTMSTTPSGGSPSDFVKWALAALPSIATAYAYPNRNGKGSMDIAAFYAASGSSRALTDADRDAVKAYIQTQAPFHIAADGGALRILKTIPDPQRVEIQVEPTGAPPFAFDWPGSATVASYDATTRKLQFSGGALPASLRAGHRIVLVGTVTGSGVTAQDGREYKIESIFDVDHVILEVGPATPPAATDIIYPGGPLVTPIRDAIVAHLNGETVYAGRGRTLVPLSKAAPVVPTGPSLIGLDELATGIGSANPNRKYGPSWSGSIVRTVLAAIVQYQQGVHNLTIVSPATDYEPLDDPFPTSDQIHYVTPSVVIVRSV